MTHRNNNNNENIQVMLKLFDLMHSKNFPREKKNTNVRHTNSKDHSVRPSTPRDHSLLTYFGAHTHTHTQCGVGSCMRWEPPSGTSKKAIHMHKLCARAATATAVANDTSKHANLKPTNEWNRVEQTRIGANECENTVQCSHTRCVRII